MPGISRRNSAPARIISSAQRKHIQTYIHNISTTTTYTKKEFRKIRTVGVGTFGTVTLEWNNREKKYVALKRLNKAKIHRMKQIEHTNSERLILSMFSHRSKLLTQLLGTFQDATHIYFMMEFVPGGELFEYLQYNKSFSENIARFCTSQVILAFEFLHSKAVIYRDLKPENLLVTVNGYLKLADFGFAKRVMPGAFAYTICGTPEYIAPEMVRHIPHTSSVDWWTLGILVHEMLMGATPFANKKEQQDDLAVYKKIAEFKVASLKLSKRLSIDAQDFIRRLLDNDHTTRLGDISTGGAASVKKHPWLMLLHWPSLIDQTFVSPFNPNVSHSGDPRNFRYYQPEEDDDEDEIEVSVESEHAFPDF